MPTDFTAAELDAIRSDFPILGRVGRGGTPIAYLDASATSQKPEAVIDAEATFYRRSNGAVHRGTHLLGDEATDAFESARDALASFVGARPDEIVWTKNATEAINLVALSMGNASQGLGGAQAAPMRVGPGDRIVCTRAEHHANIVPWQQLCQRTGAELAWLDLTPDGRIALETLSVITPNTKLVAFTHVSNVTGAVSPVAAITAAARAVGALILLDTCQSSARPVHPRRGLRGVLLPQDARPDGRGRPVGSALAPGGDAPRPHRRLHDRMGHHGGIDLHGTARAF